MGNENSLDLIIKDGLDLADKANTQLTALLDKTNVFNQITTRAVEGTDLVPKFHVFDETKLATIADRMPEINRATRSLGRKNTQVTNRLMTLTMLNGISPMRIVRQCLTEIENRRQAIKENRFKLAESYVKLNKIRYEIGKVEKQLNEIPKRIEAAQKADYPGDVVAIEDEQMNLMFDLDMKKIKMEKLITGIHDAMLYMEGALKDVASFQSSYLQIIKNKGIPENWDEQDLEKAEVEHHIQMGFLLLLRDLLVSGRIGMGTIEYLGQFGIHPMTASKIVAEYIESRAGKLGDLENKEDVSIDDLLDIDDLHKFLEDMSAQFKDEYKKVLRQIGVEDLHEDWYMYKDPSKEV